MPFFTNGMDTQHFKTKLTEELSNLEKELATVGRKNPEHEGDWQATEKMDIDTAEVGEVADSMIEYGNNTAIVAQLETRLNKVKNALAKIENGGFGICETCNEPIEEDRLEANASADTCKAHMDD